jgi:hypothetical protein
MVGIVPYRTSRTQWAQSAQAVIDLQIRVHYDVSSSTTTSHYFLEVISPQYPSFYVTDPTSGPGGPRSNRPNLGRHWALGPAQHIPIRSSPSPPEPYKGNASNHCQDGANTTYGASDNRARVPFSMRCQFPSIYCEYRSSTRILVRNE